MQNIIATRIWLALIALTFFAYILSAQGMSGRAFVLTVLITSLIKGQMIIDHYMMLKTAPMMWRIIISAWLVIVLAVIMSMYYAFG